MKVKVNHRRVGGSAVIAIMVLLSIMLIYIGANLKTLHSLKRELKLIEQRQIQRVQAQSHTSAPPAAVIVPAGVSETNKP